jgi:hypothetical protein
METSFDAPKFKSPEEELKFLREHITKREQELKANGVESSSESVAHQTLKDYKTTPTETVLHSKQVIPKAEHEALTLRLKPETHDTVMEELLGVLLSKGIKNALDASVRLASPHIDADFHRFLVQYLLSTESVPGLKEKTPISDALRMRLYEITLPEKSATDNRSLKEILSAMEQFYSGMESVGESYGNKDKNYFTLELALEHAGTQVTFYAAIPHGKTDLFEKQLASVQPRAKIREVPDDYNIFNPAGGSAGATAQLETHEVYPIKTYETFEYDPLNALIATFSKLKSVGEGASVQILFQPAGDSAIKRFHKSLEKVKEGVSLDEALYGGGAFEKHVMGTMRSIFGADGEDKPKEKKVNDTAVKNITNKISAAVLPAAIRIVASSGTRERSEAIIRDLESAFNQFSDPTSNRFKFELVQPKKLQEFLHDFSYRLPVEKEFLPLNLKELATIFHFPSLIEANPELKQLSMNEAPAPLTLAQEGVLLGINSYRGTDTEVRMAREDRMRHMYVIGQTGTGKTNLLKNMILQDIENGDGVCYMDPHGTDLKDIISHIPAHRLDDVIYFDPSYTARPFGLNMLEYDTRYPEQQTRVVDELLGIFRKLFGAVPESMGPAFEQYFRNAALLVMQDPESGSTLIEVGRVLSDKAFRELKISKNKDPILAQFWNNASQTTGESTMANYAQYVTNKFDVFVTNAIMRPIISQEKSSFNMRDVMDNKKILLVNLSKGRLGDINSNLIGLVLVGKMQLAALSRVDLYGKPINDFFLYIDEFQNITTDSISSIFSEARKYRLSLTVAHQYISQLDEGIKNSVFGNVGSMAIFRVSPEDAEILKPKFEPTFSSADISKIENYNAYVSMLVGGTPTKPFNIKTLPAPKGDPTTVAKVEELSYLKYGRPREEVEAETLGKFKKLQDHSAG